MDWSITSVPRSARLSTAAKRLPSFQLPAYGRALTTAMTTAALRTRYVAIRLARSFSAGPDAALLPPRDDNASVIGQTPE